jgi:hypothetical protein
VDPAVAVVVKAVVAKAVVVAKAAAVVAEAAPTSSQPKPKLAAVCHCIGSDSPTPMQLD